MNKYIASILFLISFCYQTHLASFEISSFSLEPRVTLFLPSSNTFQTIYGRGNPSYELQANLEFGKFSGWLNTSWFQENGNSVGFHDATRVYISNTSFGLSYISPPSGPARSYVGLGPSFGVIWLHNKSPCFSKHASKFALGLVVKLGLWIDVSEDLYVDVFVDYLYQPVSFESRQDIGGFKPGFGVGYKF